MPGPQQIGIAIIGAGWAGARHAAAYRILEDRARIVALIDADEARATQRGQAWDVEHVSSDVAVALAQADVHAVDICLPHALHATVTEAALDAGKHVLVEKPLAPSIDEANRMIKAAKQSGKILMVSENVRFNAVYRRMAELIAAGAIGEPFLCRISRDHHLHTSLRERPWFFSDPTGGIMWSGGIHDIETVRMLTRDATIESVYATAARKTLPEMDADDSSVGVFRLRGGALGMLSESFSTYVPNGVRIRVEVFGPDGSLLCERDDKLVIVGPGGAHTERIEARDTFTSAIEHFLACIATGDEPVTSARAMRPGLIAIHAARESMIQGTPITIDPNVPS
jgi:predicted dehydrogenase